MDPRTPLPRLVLDPALPPEIARILRTSPEALKAVRAGVTPPPPGPSPALIGTVAIFLLLALALTGPWGMVTLVAIVTGLGGAQALTGDPKVRDARRRLRVASRHAGRYILPEDLDQECRDLLARTQDAVDEVLNSQVDGAGLLDSIANSVMLPAEVWRLGVRLADLTRTRREHEEIVPRDLPADIAEVFTPYDEVFDRVRGSLAARVESLEEYAREVRRADAVYRAYRQLGVLRERTPDYERLLAETVEDRLAVPHIEGLNGQAQQVELVFRRSIDEARRAGTHLLSLTAA
ncbi:hypothetical protein [Sphaerisporangium perillae]|uniref:hypothetical protein n=1 Tax=Sphaerisporangium perillae TaxID=2935860 RepID=UPI00200C23C7|nr:hypothetical protein [Sphaerisporangium perillae]